MTTDTVIRVAIQGEAGSYHDKAAQLYFGEDYQARYCDNFEAVFQSVVNGETSHGLAAVENSLIGSIVPVYDLLRTHNEVVIVGEIYLPIHHSLIGLPGAQLADIRTVYSQTPALDQCREFLKRELPQAVSHPTNDTAGSVLHIKELGDISAAAIASPDNAPRLDLAILHENIEDHPENYTRFLVLSRSDRPSPNLRQANKTSLLIERLNDQADDSSAGTLYRALGCLADNDISLTKIESRPIAGRAWRYVFYLDCAAGVTSTNMQTALLSLDKLGAKWRILGSYPAGS